MKRYLFTTSLLIFWSITFTYSQSNFRNGFIITNTNDTVKGFVDFRSDVANSKFCTFKTQLNDPETGYNPGEIYGFRFIDDGKFYVSKTIGLDSLKSYVFLEFLVQGIKNLYYLPRGNGYYFFENADGTMIPVTKKEDEIVDFKLIVDNKYKGTLNYVFKDCLPLSSNTNDAFFDRKTMIDLTLKYHDKMCDTGESCILFENDYKKKYSKWSAALYSGLEFNTLNISSIYNLPTMNSISPIVGVTVAVSSPRVLKPLWFLIDLNFSRIAGACDFKYLNATDYYQYQFTANKFNFSYGLKYDFLIKNQHLYAIGKIGTTTFVSTKSKTQLDYTTTWNELKTDIFENKTLPIGDYKSVNLGFGFEIKTAKNNFITFELSYYNHYKTADKLNTYQFKVGYRIE